MKALKQILVVVMLLGIAGVIVQCQHDDSEIIPVKGPERGNDEISCTNCTPENFNTGSVGVGVWYFDKAHSNVTWETKYLGVGSLLTGRFNYFQLKTLTFKEQAPAEIAFEGFVRLNSVNTGEPGRDGSCLLTSYGTDASKTTETENLATIVSVPGSGEYRNDGKYYVDANLTFLGQTKTVSTKLDYVKIADRGTFYVCGIEAEFSFLALTDFQVNSTNISDNVKVKINATIRKKK